MTIATVRILNGALQASEKGPGGVLRGLVDWGTLSAIRVPDYQRGDLHDKSLAESFKEKDSRLPDIELAMRGHQYNRESDTFDLLDPIFVLDGLQRISAAQTYLHNGGDPANVEIGALINFDTTEDWEKARFETLNRQRRRVSADLMLRNRRDRHSGLILLYELSTHDPAFPLHGRVNWTQQRARHDLVGAFSLAKVSCTLHRGVCGISNNLEDTIANLDMVVRRIGGDVMRCNIERFFNSVEEAWGIRELPFVRSAISVKEEFLITVARVLAEHDPFWTGPDPRCRLSISQKWMQKLRAFPLDKNVANLITGGGAKTARSILYEMIVRHLNSGKTRHLIAREIIEWEKTPRSAPRKKGKDDSADDRPESLL